MSTFHGPVIQNAAFLPRNAVCAVPLSTFEFIRPSRFQRSIAGAFFRNFALATPMSDGSRLPALFLPKT